jgi:hypothetical protein
MNNDLFNIEIRDIKCKYMNSLYQLDSLSISANDIQQKIFSCNNFLEQIHNPYQQILYGIIIQSKVNTQKYLMLKLGTSTKMNLKKRLKEHTKTYGKYFIFLIKCIKNEQIEKTIHKILRKNIFTKIFYPKISYFNSTKTECYYYNDLINHSIDFLTNYINSFSMDMIDYELYYELKSKFHNTYQKLIEHNKIT